MAQVVGGLALHPAAAWNFHFVALLETADQIRQRAATV